jgi:dolichol-phosphate mannosyltransferase
MRNKEFISLIIPCFNEQDVIELTHSIVSEVMNTHFENYEIIYINDGSYDKTEEILAKINALSTQTKILNFSRNFGHEAATTAGLHTCKGEYAVILDADLQDPPKLIAEMFNIAKNQGANVVYGVRKSRDGESVFKKTTSKIFYRTLNYFSDIVIPIDTGDFRLIDRKVIDSFNSLPERNKFIRGLLTWVGFKQVPFYYDREARAGGETHYSLLKLVKLAITSTIYFSKKPLQLATNVGLTSVIISFFFLVYLIFQKILNPELILAGWTSVISLVVFFGGFVLFAIGVLGIYIGNIFEEIKNRPEYIIK